MADKQKTAGVCALIASATFLFGIAMFATNIAIGTVADLHDTNSANAESVWSALDAVQNGLGGGNEIAGGIWVLLVSWAALQTEALPRALNYLGMAAGIAGLVTVIVILSVGLVAGLAQPGDADARQRDNHWPLAHQPSLHVMTG